MMQQQEVMRQTQDSSPLSALLVSVLASASTIRGS